MGTRRVVGRIEVGGSGGEGEGRQVGQFEGPLFCTEGPVYGMEGHLFTVISILRVVCCGGISSRRGRVAHLRATDDKAKVNRLLSSLSLILLDNPLLLLFIYQFNSASSSSYSSGGDTTLFLFGIVALSPKDPSGLLTPQSYSIGILGPITGETAGLLSSLANPNTIPPAERALCFLPSSHSTQSNNV